MKKQARTSLILVIVMTCLALAIGLVFVWVEYGSTPMESELPQTTSSKSEAAAVSIEAEIVEPILPESVAVPAEFNLPVPFTTQAPWSDWGQPYQDACEEAAVLNVHYFYEGKSFTKEIANQEILDFVDFENSYLGFYRSTTVAELVDVTKEYLGYERIDIIDDPSVADIKVQVAAGRPVIVPAAGRELGNPYFTQPGPVYHMYVIRGYDDTKFYTNDIGVGRGENYAYDIEVVMTSISDWDGRGNLSREKRVIVIYPNK
jgi:hypothetical protein